MGSTASSSRSSADEREEPPRRRQADRRNASNSPPRYSRRSRGKRDNREGKGGKGGSQKPPNSIKSSSSAQVAQNSVQPNLQYQGKGGGGQWTVVGGRGQKGAGKGKGNAQAWNNGQARPNSQSTPNPYIDRPYASKFTPGECFACKCAGKEFKHDFRTCAYDAQMKKGGGAQGGGHRPGQTGRGKSPPPATQA